MPGSRLPFAALAALLLGPVAAAHAAPEPAPTPEQLRFFETKVRPLFAEHCLKCHGPEKKRGGLRLDSRAAMLEGGDAGPAIEPGKPDQSLLIRAVRQADELKMPPDGKKLTDTQIALLTRWVVMGAPAPDTAKPTRAARGKITDEDRAWWAFQPVRQAPVPDVEDGAWARNPIDRFIFARLKAEGLRPAPEADRATLVRRVYFDLLGLPPTPAQVKAFLADQSPGAYARLIDRLLASPRYGERWARHWLDLVRYADSDGYRIDDYRPHAWRYRDYVIASFNHDKPYDRFVQEQLAGDELFPDSPEALVATGYLRHWIYEYNNRDVRGQWTTILDDLTDTTGDVFFGLGIQCARCHDHKFDPILQKDYYRLQAFFAPILPREDLNAATPDEVKRHQAQLASWEAQTAELRRRIAAIEAPYRKTATREAIAKFPADIQKMIRTPVPERTPLEHQLAQLAYRQVDYEYDHLERRLKGKDKETVLALRRQLAAFDKDKPPPLPVAFAATDVGPKAPPVFIPKKGGLPIEPGFPTLFDEAPAAIDPVPSAPHSTGRRSALARWLTRPDNPLTARVIVNRVWQYHFGRGLAASASDLGRLGEKPTHPELLDWLAGRLVRKGWSLKNLHRLILTSATYRQSSRHPQAERYRGNDPANRLYWHRDTRRLDAEQIRDAILAVTGELDLTAGGPGVNSSQPRRSIFAKVLRNTRDPLLEAFDWPLFFASASSRDTTTTPVQSLLLINGQAMLLRGQAFAARLEREGGGSEGRMIERAYQLAFGRKPGKEETVSALQFLREQARRIDPAAAGSASAKFLHDRIPYRDGQAAVLSPAGPQKRFEVPHDERMPAADFTIEAFFRLDSIYDSGAVRTLAAKWDGNVKAPGWGFGVSGKRSRRKPQTLVLQVVGKKRDGSVGEAAVFSDQHVQLHKPYYAAAAVRLAGAKPGSVTFYLKDLSNDDEPLLVASVPHQVTGAFANKHPLTLGGVSGTKEAFFDGLLDDVRLSRGALGVGQLLYTSERTTRATVGYWRFEARPDAFRDSSGNGLHIRPAASVRADVPPRRAALADFCQVLLNANEFLYVD
jgi:mono/diheme cytochrome c family protein